MARVTGITLKYHPQTPFKATGLTPLTEEVTPIIEITPQALTFSVTFRKNFSKIVMLVIVITVLVVTFSIVFRYFWPT